MSHLCGNILKINTVIHSNNRNGQTERKTKICSYKPNLVSHVQLQKTSSTNYNNTFDNNKRFKLLLKISQRQPEVYCAATFRSSLLPVDCVWNATMQQNRFFITFFRYKCNLIKNKFKK